MDKIDEKIVNLKREKKELDNMDINQGVFINDERITFSRQMIYKDQMSIMLPDSFVTMPKKMAQMKYPSELRPQIIKTDYAGMVNFAFNLFLKKIKQEQINGAAKSMKTMIRNMNPANVFFEEELIQKENMVISLFDYKSFAMDQPVYNMVFISSIGENIMQGIFNCAYSISGKWKPIARQVIESMQDLTSSEGK